MKNSAPENKKNRREFIDVFTDAIKNQRDVDDCIAVPRGIFKAYIFIMSGSALLTLSTLIKGNKAFGKKVKTLMIVAGWILNTLSALYFAKPFAFKGNSPTVKREDLKKNFAYYFVILYVSEKWEVSSMI